MARKRYDPKTKAAFIAAAISAREAGESWAAAFKAAKGKGYTGTPSGLYQLLHKPGKSGAGRKRKAGRPAAAGVNSIESLVEKIVQERVQKALAKAANALRNAAT